MSLGFARDSMLNLAELAHQHDEEEELENDDDAAHQLQLQLQLQLTEDDEGVVEGGSTFSKLAGSIDYGEEQPESKNEANNVNNVESVNINVNNVENVNVNNVEITEGAAVAGLNPSTNLNNTKPQQSKGQPQQYAGFSADYHDFENYASSSLGEYGDPYGSNSNNKSDEPPCWLCIFPWLSAGDYADKVNDSSGPVTTEDLTTQNEEEGPSTTETDNSNSNNNNTADDEISMISAGSDNALGERLSERDHQAVLARLRLAQPDATTDDAVVADNQKKNLQNGNGIDNGNGNGNGNGSDNVIDETPDSKTVKGILKVTSRQRIDPSRSNVSSYGGSNSSIASQKQNQRRSLFPAYEPPKAVTKTNLNIQFSPMARVINIKPSTSMTDEEKASIWWQKANYDEFRKTGRMISKVMLQGGSEIWLATNQSWQQKNEGKAATLRRAMASVDNEDTSQKWWHKFGHSRRGLEHIASIDEGRQRQSNVKTAIRSILTEQRRQKAFRREDPEKLRMCSVQNTSWAKDLALASGASDADAVQNNFDDGSRKSREFFLLKFSRTGQLNANAAPNSGPKQVVPAFMKPMVSMQLKNRLDANTTSRLQFEKKEEKATSFQHQHKRVSSDVPAMRTAKAKAKPSIRVPIHDPGFDESGKESLAHKAAGFANGEEAVNMSAILAGIGPVPKTPDAARARPVLA